MSSIKIQFLGAAGTVTGSKFLITAFGKKILIDCGLFQGLKELRQQLNQRLRKDLERLYHCQVFLLILLRWFQ